MASIDFGPIAGLVAEPGVTEIMINGHDEVWVERGGVIEATEVRFKSEHDLLHLIQQIAAFCNRRVSADEAMLDARLPDGSRVNVVLPPLTLSGPTVTIRRFARDMLSAEALIAGHSASKAALDFMHACVVARRNILISGRTGSGKTTLLNILSAWIPPTERIVSVEDSAELNLLKPHWVRMETRPADMTGRNEVTCRQLVRNSLRMRPDRIIVGEVRGAEAVDMLQAMNTGHDGSLSTIHANSPRDALQRLETLCLMAGLDMPHRSVRDQIASAINLLIHVDRDHDGHRHVAAISEIVGREGEVVTMQDLFVMEDRIVNGQRTRVLVPTMVRPKALDAMVRVRQHLPAGLRDVYPDARLAA